MSDSSRGYQQFFAELKRRRVFRVMAMYGVVAFIVLQVADLVFPILELPNWTLQFVLMLTLLGFPIAIVLAWAFQATDEGIRRAMPATDTELDAISRAPASERIPSGILALVGIVALVLGAWWVGRRTAPTDPLEAAQASIAVLPLVDMSPNGDQEWFSDGIAEELLSLLGKIPELHVAARTSSFSFKGKDLAIPVIADSLNVAHVLEGSVRMAGGTVRITAQLIRADDGFHVWSQTWDRPYGDIFAIQDEIAADVAEQLKVTLLGAVPTIAVTDPEAYALYLQARHLFQLGVPGGEERTIDLYRQALAIDSTYAPAWAGLADAFRLLISNGALDTGTGQPFDFGLAKEAANRALTIDSTNVEAHLVMGDLAAMTDNDHQAQVEHYSRALAYEPTNPQALGRTAYLLSNLGRSEDGIRVREYAVDRDPLNTRARFFLGRHYVAAGRFDDAIAAYRRALNLSPGIVQIHALIGIVLLQKGQPEQALKEMEAEPDETWRLIGLAMTYHTLGETAAADSVLADLIDRFGRTWAYQIAYVMAWRNEPDRAFEWLNLAVENNDPGLTLIGLESRLFANIHDDPRWLPFLESIGRSPGQLAAIEFEMRLPE